MKKILAFLLAVLMLSATCVVSASAAADDLSQKFYDYCVENLPESMQPSEGDDVKIGYSVEVDGVTYFTASCNWLNSEVIELNKKYGEWNIHSNITLQPYELGVYAASGDEIYTLEQAYDYGFITDFSPLRAQLIGYLTFYRDYIGDPDNKFEEFIIPEVLSASEWDDPEFYMYYHEGYEYYSPDNTSTGDEATPDYVLIHLTTNLVLNAPTAMLYGSYVTQSMSINYPVNGYGIYIPDSQEFYSLSYAYELGIEGIYNVFTEAGVGDLIGDMDKDRKLTVRDATYIQKCLAGIAEFDKNDAIYAFLLDEKTPVKYISDFNRDSERNIKDATAIQKYIAGIEG